MWCVCVVQHKNKAFAEVCIKNHWFWLFQKPQKTNSLHEITSKEPTILLLVLWPFHFWELVVSGYIPRLMMNEYVWNQNCWCVLVNISYHIMQHLEQSTQTNESFLFIRSLNHGFHLSIPHHHKNNIVVFYKQTMILINLDDTTLTRKIGSNSLCFSTLVNW